MANAEKNTGEKFEVGREEKKKITRVLLCQIMTPVRRQTTEVWLPTLGAGDTIKWQ